METKYSFFTVSENQEVNKNIKKNPEIRSAVRMTQYYLGGKENPLR